MIQMLKIKVMEEVKLLVIERIGSDYEREG